MRLILILIAMFSISTALADARADVALRNGNFYVSFLDLSYSGGMEPKIQRIYNSKSDITGIFGYSWGSMYELKMKINEDGSISIREFGQGSENHFSPKNYKPADLEVAVKQMIEAAKKGGFFATAQQRDGYYKKLMSDVNYRSKQYLLLVGKGLMPARKIADGTQLTSTRRFYEFITKVKGGYVRVESSGNIQKFNDAGYLVQVQDRNKNFINFTYNANGKMIGMIDNQNRKMQLSYNPQGRLEKVTGESGKSASYRYNKDGLLEYSKDEKGIENTFKYTNDVYRNLSEIGYLSEKDSKGQPKKVMISYYGPEKNGSTKSVTNIDGSSNEYIYVMDPKNPDYYSAQILSKNTLGAKTSDAKYEYYTKKRVGGEDFILKMISTVDGDKTETIYDERLGFPVKINSNGRSTTMAYDTRGRMIKKVTPIETTELTYHPSLGKVSRVSRKLRSGTVLWSAFDYDPANSNLILAKNSDKKQVKLVYDSVGRIRALIDQTGRQLTFKYNELSKPIEIADARLGTIKITYKNSGEVDKMDSNGGASAASDVLRALQNLIDITAPAGVTMSL